MNFIREMRNTCVTVTRCEQQALVGGAYSFDFENRHLGLFDSLAPKWFHDSLQHLVASLPDVSFTQTMDVANPETGVVFATVLIERFVNATIGRVLDAVAQRIPEQEAIVDMSSGKRVSYRELNALASHMARVFLDLGIRRGDVVSVLLPNSLEQSITKLGLHKAGGVADNLSPHENCQGIKNLLAQTDATTLVLRPGIKTDESINAIYTICPELKTAAPGRLVSADLPRLKSVIVIGADERYPGTFRFEDLMASEPRSTPEDLERRLASVTAQDVATIIHTSGSTKIPKSVMLSHGTVVTNALSHVEELGITASDRILVPVPIFHAFGGIGGTFSAIVAGATMIAMWKPKPRQALQTVRDERCSILMTVPTFAISLVEAIKDGGAVTNGTILDLCVMAGAECPPKARKEVRDVLGARDVLVMYGMSEAGPGITSTRPGDSQEVKFNTVGRPWPGVKIKLDKPITGENGAVIGEICVKGYNLMRGYYKDQAETSAAIDAEGWLHTGDLGRIREDGNLIVCGRKKDIITRHGENISPREIEEYLENHPRIARACVVGAKDYKSGEVICAFINARAPRDIEADDVLAHCRSGLASIKIPTYVHFLEDFPKSETGKLSRRELQALAQQIHDRGEPSCK